MTNSVYDDVKESAFGMSLSAIWQHLSIELNGALDYDGRVVEFFSLLRWLMESGVLKLAHDGKFLAGSVCDQINLLKSKWPVSPQDDDLDGFGLWFHAVCPVGAVWIDSSGMEFWS